MDDTKKALLSIDIDTAALTQNAANAKAAVAALADQLKELKASGKDSGEAFDKVTEQLKKAGEEAKKSTETLKEYGKGLTESAKAASDLKNSTADLSVQQQKTTQDATANAASLDVLNMRYSASKNEISALKQQFQALNNESITLKDTHGKNSAQVLALQTGLLSLSGQIKTAQANSTEYKQAIDALNTSQQNAGKDAATTTKSVADYTSSVLKAAESHTPFGKTIGEMVQGFSSVKDSAGKVIDGFSNYKKEVSAALDNSKTFNSNAGLGAKAFEALKVGTEVATGGIGNFTKALAGTGIGLIIVAVAALIDYLSKFQPVVDLVEQVMAGFNGALAAGKHILDEFFGSIKSVGDLFSKLGNFIAHPIDSLRNLGNAMAEAAVKTYKLQEAQQKLNEKLQEDTVKAAQNAAEIARLRTEAQTAGLARQKEIAAQIKKIQNDQTKDERDHAEEQIRINVNKVLATNGARALEKKDIEDLDLEKIKSLATSKHLNAEDVKSLEDAVKQMADLRKQASEKLFKENEDRQTKQKAGAQKHAQEMDAIQASRDRMRLATLHDEKAKELAEIDINFTQLQKQYKGQTAVLAQLAKERKQQIADVEQKFKDEVAKRDAVAANELAHLQFEKEIKDAEGNYEQIKVIKLKQLAADKAFELSNANLTANEKLFIEEKFNQKALEIQKEYREAADKKAKEDQQKIFDDLLEQDQKEIVQNDKNDKLKLQAQLKYLNDKHDADIFNAGTNAKLKSKIDEQYFADKQKLDEAYLKATQKTFQGELKLIDQKAQHYQQHFTKLAGLFSKNTQASKAAFAAQKAIAAAEIAINTEKQVSSIISATRTAVSDDMELGPIVGPIKAAIDIAIGAAEVVGTIANGVKQATTINSTNPQGFARGGMYLSDGYGAYLTGPGNGTSDNINARLSNGESIINARSTEMFAPILSAINQAGGGRAFNSTNASNGYALGGIFSGSNTLNDSSTDLANARALNDMARTMAANMPRQILVVEDVQASLQNKAMLQSMSNF